MSPADDLAPDHDTLLAALALAAPLAAALCVVALGITVWQFLATASTVSQALAILGIVVVSLAVELVFRIFEKVEKTPRAA